MASRFVVCARAATPAVVRARPCRHRLASTASPSPVKLGRDAQFGSFMSDDAEALAALSLDDFEHYYAQMVAPELADALFAVSRVTRHGTPETPSREHEHEDHCYTGDPNSEALFESPPLACLGHGARPYFSLDLGPSSEKSKSQAGWAFLNHGAFGAASLPVMAASERWRRLGETQPLRFADRLLLPSLVRAMHHLASTLGLANIGGGLSGLAGSSGGTAKLSAGAGHRLALLPNATTGLNAVIGAFARDQRLASASGRAERSVLVLEVGYGAVKKICERHEIGVIVVGLPLGPGCGEEAVVEALAAALRAAATSTRLPCLAVVDHVTSNSAARMPIKALAKVCEAWGVPLLVDGAHGPGHLVQECGDLASLGASYYVGNCHKWLCSAKGAGFLVAFNRPEGHSDLVSEGRDNSDRLRPLPRPLPRLLPPVASHGFGTGGLISDFLWDGNRDYAALLSLPTAIKMRRWLDTQPALPPRSCLVLRQKAGDGGSSGSEEGRNAAEARTGQVAEGAAAGIAAGVTAGIAAGIVAGGPTSLSRVAVHGAGVVAAEVAMLEAAWGTGGAGHLFAAELSGGLMMGLAELPPHAPAKARAWLRGQAAAGDTRPVSANWGEGSLVQEWLYRALRVEVPVKAHQGRLFVRLSAHAYSEESDVLPLRGALLT